MDCNLIDSEHDTETISTENINIDMPEMKCNEKGHVYALEDIISEGVTKRKLICKRCGKVFHVAEVNKQIQKTSTAVLQYTEVSSSPKVSKFDINLYREYVKPSLWDNLLFWVIFFAVLFVLGVLNVTFGNIIYGVIFIIVGVALLSLFVYSYGSETEKYRHAMDDPQLPEYAADFSKSEIFRGDAFRMGKFYLYKHGVPVPVDYKNIDRVRLDVKKKILVTANLKIFMKNDNIGVTLCQLTGKDLRPGPENDMLGKMIAKLQGHNPSISFQQQELLFHDPSLADSKTDKYCEVHGDKKTEPSAEAPILLIFYGRTVQIYRLSGKQLLGRPSQQESPELQVQNQSVSRRHGEFVVQSGLYAYRDLSSKNGTFLNGNLLEPMVFYDLHDGDMLRISTNVIIVYFDRDYTEEQDVEEETAFYL